MTNMLERTVLPGKCSNDAPSTVTTVQEYIDVVQTVRHSICEESEIDENTEESNHCDLGEVCGIPEESNHCDLGERGAIPEDTYQCGLGEIHGAPEEVYLCDLGGIVDASKDPYQCKLSEKDGVPEVAYQCDKGEMDDKPEDSSQCCLGEIDDKPEDSSQCGLGEKNDIPENTYQCDIGENVDTPESTYLCDLVGKVDTPKDAYQCKLSGIDDASECTYQCDLGERKNTPEYVKYGEERHQLELTNQSGLDEQEDEANSNDELTLNVQYLHHQEQDQGCGPEYVNDIPVETVNISKHSAHFVKTDGHHVSSCEIINRTSGINGQQTESYTLHTNGTFICNNSDFRESSPFWEANETLYEKPTVRKETEYISIDEEMTDGEGELPDTWTDSVRLSICDMHTDNDGTTYEPKTSKGTTMSVWRSCILNTCLVISSLNLLTCPLVIYFVHKAKRRPLADRYTNIAMLLALSGMLLTSVSVYYMATEIHVTSSVGSSPQPTTTTTMASPTFCKYLITNPTVSVEQEGVHLNKMKVAPRGSRSLVWRNESLAVFEILKTGEYECILNPIQKG